MIRQATLIAMADGEPGRWTRLRRYFFLVDPEWEELKLASDVPLLFRRKECFTAGNFCATEGGSLAKWVVAGAAGWPEEFDTLNIFVTLTRDTPTCYFEDEL